MDAPNRLVAIIVYNGLCLFEYGIAFELFGFARPELGVDWYECRRVGLDGPLAEADGGALITASDDLSLLDKAGTIIMPGWRDRAEVPPAELISALQNAVARGARLLTICSGAFVAAQAGLLDGKRATTHWRYADDFRARFLQVRYDDDVLYVDEGSVITSAGSAAGMDAGLHLIRCDFGAGVANMVARRLVMQPHREGGQAQYVEAPVMLRPGRTIGQVLDWARARLDQPISVAALAAQSAMSPRSFLRHFAAATGISPKTWLQQERMARARALLETGGLSLDDVAAHCGYASPETFRTVFKQKVGVAPGAYRARFAA